MLTSKMNWIQLFMQTDIPAREKLALSQKKTMINMISYYFNSLWPIYDIWKHRPASTLAQVIACCLMSLSHFLKECGLFISNFLWHLLESYFTMSTPMLLFHMSLKIIFQNSCPSHLPGPSGLSDSTETARWELVVLTTEVHIPGTRNL